MPKSRYLAATAVTLTLALQAPATLAELQTKTMDYEVNGETYTGYMAWDDEAEHQQPGVLVVHEWWGHNEFAREQAEKLAASGYTAFALDMYGSGKQADHPDTAGEFAREATRDLDQTAERFRKAMELLQNHESVDPDRIAAQGYCFGGAVVLNMARMGMDLDGVVSYHGSLSSPIQAQAGKTSARVQVYTGGADPMVPAEQVAGLVREMQNAEVDLTLVSFPGVQHSFTNPAADQIAEKFDMPVGYDEDAARRAWEGTLSFYEEIFAE